MKSVRISNLFAPPRGEHLRAAVLTSYQFDIDHLEEAILPTLLGVRTAPSDPERPDAPTSFFLEMRRRLQAARVAVLVDASQYDSTRKRRYETYDLHLVRGFPTFHPKLYLLAFDRSARAIVTSANLTVPGFHRNLEVLWWGEEIPREAVRFVETIARREWPSSRSLREVLEAIRLRASDVAGVRVIHSEAPRPILGQLLGTVPARERIDEVHVVSPYFDHGLCLEPLERIEARSARGAPVCIYIAGERTAEGEIAYRLPVQPAAIRHIRSVAYRAIRFDGEPRTLHGKLLALRAGRRGWALLGSPNCTLAALMGRNAEVAVLISGSWASIVRLLPPADPLDAKEVEFVHPVTEGDGRGRLPFITLAEYLPSKRQIRLVFDRRARSRGAWEVWYGPHRICKGRTFPTERILAFRLIGEPDLVLKKDGVEAHFPIVVAEKEMLQLVPGLDLSLDDILEYLGSGVSNLQKFADAVRERQNRAVAGANVDEVAAMTRLRRLVAALEGLLERLGRPIEDVATARAHFKSDVGVEAIAELLGRDPDPAFAQFGLLELASLLRSIRWRGTREGRAAAAQLMRQCVRTISRRLRSVPAARKIAPLRRVYERGGRNAWRR